MTRRALTVLLPGLLGIPILAMAGGWAVITVEALPDHAVMGRPVDLAFVVRQHGLTMLEGLEASVEAKAAGREVTAPAKPGSRKGHYSASLTLPGAGDWTITIHSGFGNSRITLLPLMVIDANAAPPPAPSGVERGRRLFVAKGCITCHIHGDVAATTLVEVGPELTYKRYQAEYLSRLLADPSIAAKPGAPSRMPNLELKTAEIASLVAFVNAERAAGR